MSLGKKAPAAETMESIQVGLRKLKIPALIIWGEKDPVFSPRLVKIWHAYFPGSKSHILPGVSHFPQEDEPGEILAIMRDFLYGAKPGSDGSRQEWEGPGTGITERASQ